MTLNLPISVMNYGRTGFVGFAGTDVLAAATAALSAARAAWRASLVVAAALAASKLLFAVAMFAFVVAIAALRASRAAVNCALAALKAAFSSGESATFFTTGAGASVANEAVIPTKDIDTDAATKVVTLIALFILPPYFQLSEP